MPKKKKPVVAPDLTPLDPAVMIWDSQSKREWAELSGTIREGRMHLTAGLVTDMEETWDGVFTHLKTSTNTETGEITVGRGDPEDPDSVAFQPDGRSKNGYFSVWVPLQKLSVKIPAGYQWTIKPYVRPLLGGGAVYVFNIRNRQTIRRKVEETSGETALAVEPEEE
jgi:hypothetical protein